MQATVRSMDAATGSGTVLLDDGRELAFPAGALAGSGLRLVRIGQRLHVTVEQDVVTALGLTPSPRR